MSDMKQDSDRVFPNNLLYKGDRAMKPQGRTSIAGCFALYDTDIIRATLKSSSLSGQKNIRPYLRKMLAAGGYRHLISPVNLDCIDEVDRLCPNFHEVSREIRKAVALALMEGCAIRIPPILLLGKPGIGKTHYANEISKALGVGMEFFSMSFITTGWIIGGATPIWEDAGIGNVARRLIEYQAANPFMFLDELDKVGNVKKYNPIGALYTLLEEETACSFRDEYLGIPIDASRVTWVATANEERSIPPPIRSRMMSFSIREPNRDEVRMIAREIYGEMVAKYPRSDFDSQMDDRVIDKLSEMVPRDIRLTLISAFGSAALARRRHLTAEDIRLVGSSKPKMGFC
jgi:ATP-dependent Lon protease